MKIARFLYNHREAYGTVEGDRVRPLEGGIFREFGLLDETFPLSQVRLLPPVTPSKILAVAFNYRSHLHEMPPPSNPELFFKPSSALIGPEDSIVLPPGSERVDYEGELVAVIGQRARRVEPEEALDYVLGYTCGNDVSARDWQQGDLQWWRAKGCDTFAPLGPWITTDLDPTSAELRTRVNGQEVQSTNTSLLIHDVAHLISFATQAMTLEPGDLVFSGTPGTTAPLQKGDVVEVEISGIGVLRNPVQGTA